MGQRPSSLGSVAHAIGELQASANAEHKAEVDVADGTALAEDDSKLAVCEISPTANTKKRAAPVIVSIEVEKEPFQLSADSPPFLQGSVFPDMALHDMHNSYWSYSQQDAFLWDQTPYYDSGLGCDVMLPNGNAYGTVASPVPTTPAALPPSTPAPAYPPHLTPAPASAEPPAPPTGMPMLIVNQEPCWTAPPAVLADSFTPRAQPDEAIHHSSTAGFRPVATKAEFAGEPVTLMDLFRQPLPRTRIARGGLFLGGGATTTSSKMTASTASAWLAQAQEVGVAQEVEHCAVVTRPAPGLPAPGLSPQAMADVKDVTEISLHDTLPEPFLPPGLEGQHYPLSSDELEGWKDAMRRPVVLQSGG